MMKAALIVGINTYTNMPDNSLSGCLTDALTLRELLSNNSLDGSPNFDCRLLSGEEETTAPFIRENLEELFNRDVDVALFYFSGHGTIGITGGYLVTSDAAKHQVGINMAEVMTMAQKSKIRNKIIILDCCHAASMGDVPAVGDNTVISEGITVLSSCRQCEYSLENDAGGVFTALLAEALRGGAADLVGNITPGSIYAYIDNALGAWEQRPVFKTNVSRFVSLRQVSPPIATDCLRRICQYFNTKYSQFQLDPSYEFTSPSANQEHVKIFKELQKMAGVGLIVPVEAEHMYFAAINSTACRLTALGAHYWSLVKSKKI